MSTTATRDCCCRASEEEEEEEADDDDDDLNWARGAACSGSSRSMLAERMEERRWCEAALEGGLGAAWALLLLLLVLVLQNSMGSSMRGEVCSGKLVLMMLLYFVVWW